MIGFPLPSLLNLATLPLSELPPKGVMTPECGGCARISLAIRAGWWCWCCCERCAPGEKVDPSETSGEGGTPGSLTLLPSKISRGSPLLASQRAGNRERKP